MTSRPYISFAFWILCDQELSVLWDHELPNSGDYVTKNLKYCILDLLIHICAWLKLSRFIHHWNTFSRFFHHCNTSQFLVIFKGLNIHFHCWNAIKGDAEVYKDPWSTRTKSAPGGTKTLSVLGFGSDSHVQWCVLDSLFIFYCSATDGEVQIDHHGVDDKMMGQELQRRKLLSC